MFWKPREYLLTAAIWVPAPLTKVFPFFADAGNLNALTPASLGFTILTPMPLEMRAGLNIDYKISLHGLPMRWRTKITAWEPVGPVPRFMDEQVKGPYATWIHEHMFTSRDGGTECCDRVRYAHWGGPLAERWMVRPELLKIFGFRSAKRRLWAFVRP